jgi:hypothetical protein
MLHNVPSFGDALVAFDVVVELALLHVGLDDSANLGVNVMILKYFRQKMEEKWAILIQIIATCA